MIALYNEAEEFVTLLEKLASSQVPSSLIEQALKEEDFETVLNEFIRPMRNARLSESDWT